MATNLDYLNPDLQPLVQKVEEYLAAKEDLRKATIAGHSEPPQYAEIQRLAAEVLALLPTRDEWVKVNLGYGPSRVGAWRVPNLQDPSQENYEIRVVV